MDEIAMILHCQEGVIARRQVLATGRAPAYVARRIRRREWVVVHPGVYVNHTGPLTWRQRAWAAVLAYRTAALAGRSAIRAHEGPGRRQFDDGQPIEVIVRHGRRPKELAGVQAREARGFDETVQLDRHPPRQRYDDAIIELADRATDELAAIAVLADACGARRTTASRLLGRIEQTSRLRRRMWLGAVLADVAEGTCSVLEHAYLTKVERAHGLPRGRRQVSGRDGAGRSLFRDVVYSGSSPSWRQYVELDGRLHHDSARARDADMERDLDAALDGADTVRIGYGQVFLRTCATAVKVGRLLQDRGWDGAPVRCPDCATESSAGD